MTISATYYILNSYDLWPQYMTFDLINIWRIPCGIYDPSFIAIGVCTLHLCQRLPFWVMIFQMCIFLYSNMYTTLFKVLFSLYYMAYKIESDIYDTQCKNNNSLLWWPLTLVCDLWPHWHMAVHLLHLLSKFHCNCSLYGEVITQDKKCSPNCWRTHTHTDTQTDEACSHKVFSSNDLKITFWSFWPALFFLKKH